MSLFDAFLNKKIDDALLEDIESILISSDLGLPITEKIINDIKKVKIEKIATMDDIKPIIAKHIKKYIKNVGKKLTLNDDKKPNVFMFIGINASGKTTIIGKYANQLKKEGKKVLIAACDTFRAGAVQQIDEWCKKVKVDIVKPEKDKQDPASVVYKSLEKAKKENYDVLLIDTAGRMQNNVNLINELKKIERVVKLDEIILVLDATIGQNALKQVETFGMAVNISGLVMNKLDGTAKGGILVPISEKFNKPVYFCGMGEGIEDLKEFDADIYIEKILK
ncbi:MAG: signal recognition particle-docking protein FtsY [Rickettsiales bacterium]|jgi:fused signal recognition particle receptor|nr:signal recognition particle-docking protein FtsY [Rickettsiales bacterium]